MKFDKPLFYNTIKPMFTGGLNKNQVAGTEMILDTWLKSYQKRTPPTQLAVCLGTTFHETAQTMQPIHEHGNAAYFTKLYDMQGANRKRAIAMGNTHPGDGAKYCGRGLVQLTWLENYLKADTALRAMGLLLPGESLVETPDLAMRDDLAVVILFEGMEGGWFTGLSLDRMVDPVIDGDEYADFVQSRKIINGVDRAPLIAGYEKTFLSALQKSYWPNG